MIETQELVVPKSIPITLLMTYNPPLGFMFIVTTGFGGEHTIAPA
jgi:hypothetical protein